MLQQGKAQHDLYPRPVVQNRKEKKNKQTKQVYTIFRTVPTTGNFFKETKIMKAGITLAILEVHENLMTILVLCLPQDHGV